MNYPGFGAERAAARVLGGWQLNSDFSFQSGAHSTPLNGSDPTAALSGIDVLVGNGLFDRDALVLNLRHARDRPTFRASWNDQQQRQRSPSKTLRPGQRVGSGRPNILRADGIRNIDFGF